jgi:hypothetical protein
MKRARGILAMAIYILLILFMGSLAVPNLGIAQGTSPVKVNKITVTPATFKIGNNLTITVEIENTSRSTYGCVGGTYFKVFLSVFKATPFHVSNQLWTTNQPLTTALNPGEKRSITFTSKWTVPNIDTDKFIFHAGGPICAPDEFNQTASRTFSRSCTYSSPLLVIHPGIGVHIKELLR